jgi:hypothetical protein
MMKKALIIVALLSFISCNATKQAQRKLSKIEKHYPELFSADTTYLVRNDTVLVAISSSEFDTIVAASDTVIIENERVRVQIETIKEPFEVVRYRVLTTVKADTFELIRTDTIYTIQKEVITKTLVEKEVPRWFIVIMIIMILTFSYITFFKR